MEDRRFRGDLIHVWKVIRGKSIMDSRTFTTRFFYMKPLYKKLVLGAQNAKKLLVLTKNPSFQIKNFTNDFPKKE